MTSDRDKELGSKRKTHRPKAVRFNSSGLFLRELVPEEKPSIVRRETEDKAIEIKGQSAQDDEDTRHQHRCQKPIDKRDAINRIDAGTGEDHHRSRYRSSQMQNHQHREQHLKRRSDQQYCLP